MNPRTLPTEGRKSPRFGHLGMWNLSLGPDSPFPGERLRIVLLNQDGKAVRRFEQIKGHCIDPGYVDFFLSHKCRPALHELPIVDIDADGQIVKVLHPDYRASLGQALYLQLIEAWAKEHGRPEWAL